MHVTSAIQPLPRRLLTFGGHYLEMCVSMCAVGLPLTLGVIALLGGASFRAAYPELSLLLIAVTLSLPMTAWMLFRGMGVRSTVEMDAVSIVVVVLIAAAAAAGVVVTTTTELTVGQICTTICVAMLAFMVIRFNEYSGHGHRGA